jgi:AAA+ superfamily predicted ATPase
LIQNAIVGVFLRVLEYHASVLFLTTNRPDLVDDAIASRCVARIDYKYPNKEDQVKIWEILSEGSDITIAPEEINKFTEKNKEVSGRDIKNLLKLAMLITQNTKKPITCETLEYVLQFKPTNKEKKQEET